MKKEHMPKYHYGKNDYHNAKETKKLELDQNNKK